MPTTKVPASRMISYDTGSFCFRNKIINGDMRISQRGTNFSSVANTVYTLDRWSLWNIGTGTTVNQVTGPSGFVNALQITGVAGNTGVGIQQKIEAVNCQELSGATITVQARISASTAQSVAIQLITPAGFDNWVPAGTVINTSWINVTSNPTTYSVTVPNLPSSVLNGLMLVISPNNGGGLSSGTFTITGVQLEVGPTATPFEHRPIGTELALCQRYYQALAGVSGSRNDTQYSDFTVIYPVPMRSTPQVTATYANGNSTPVIESARAIFRAQAGNHVSAQNITFNAEL